MRTSVTRQQVESLIDAGLGAAQLGIETFSTPILKLMCKGVTALQNLQALKWFSNWPIEIKWNLLYGFPREDPGEYAKLADLLPSLVHLAPPLAVGQVRMDRFAPYFEDPVAFGLIHPRPHRAFAHVYPFPTESLARLAYYFEYDYADGRRPLDYAQPVVDAARAWQQLKGAVTFRAFDREDGLLLLTDNRPCAAAFQRRLSGLKRKLYLFCDAGRTFEQIVEHTAESGEARVPNTAAIRALLDSWVSSRLAANVDDRYLSLATAVRE